MTILFINNLGGGFCDRITIADGTTIRGLFEQRVPHGKPDDFLVRVNRLVCPADQILREGDRVSITPVKIEGAA